MEGERPLVVTEEYERLGGKKLSLIDVLAQSIVKVVLRTTFRDLLFVVEFYFGD